MNDTTRTKSAPGTDGPQADAGGGTPGAHLLALPELGARPPELPPSGRPARADPGEARGELLNPLRRVKASLTVVVGTAEITIGDLLDAKQHQVLKLDRSVEAPVDILLEGQIVARGILVAVDDRFGVRITEVPTELGAPLRSAETSR